tara:strand:+ start:225 stop:689 length:465 start_codon:yes stop_codon:yes gene_type:complete
MKKIGYYTARGIVFEDESEAGTPQKISLFDGSFKTGYRITSFRVWGATPSGSEGFVVGKLSKNDIGTTAAANFFRADDDNQIAWSQSAAATDGGNHTMGDFIIDRDNLVIEDLYVYVRANNDATAVNYLIEMEKYEISESQGALMMARDRADGE